MPSLVFRTVLCLLAWVQCFGVFAVDDWPMWRFDAQRSAASENRLPDHLNLLWEREFGARTQAWDDPLNLDLMTYDRVFEPIVLDGTMFVGFNDEDKLLALDAQTGDTKWTFFAEGPVRLPPVGWQGKVYFCSDDGFLYCVKASDGALLWKFRGAPNSQHALGNRRLTSAWPARGGPVVFEDTVYFAASIWPFMGTFLYALKAESGEVQWVNDSTGAQYIQQPHSAPSFAGVAPQGALVATDQWLIVPGGRSVPAVFDRNNGQLKYFEINAGGKGTGGSFVAADRNHFYVHTREKGTRAFNLATGLKTAFMPNEPVLKDGLLYSAELDGGRHVVRAYDVREPGDPAREPIWEMPVSGTSDMVLAGDRLIAVGGDQLSVILLPGIRDEQANPDGSKSSADAHPAVRNTPKIALSMPVDREIARLLVADEKLFAVTTRGTIMAFGEGSVDADLAQRRSFDVANGPQAELDRQVSGWLSAGDAAGYALWYGDARDERLFSLAMHSPFDQLAVVDQDSDRVSQLRNRLEGLRRYGSVTAHVSDPVDFRAPKYIANMVFVAPGDSSENSHLLEARALRAIYESVRPYGGWMYLIVKNNRAAVAELVKQLDLEQAQVDLIPEGVRVRRVGALPGSADWTHQYGNIANTIKSDDSRVKLPLGILWFGGSSNVDVLPRHGHGPPEQVVGGRLFIEGMNCLSARDVYTGRVLWKRDFEDLGTFDVYYDATYDNTPLDPKYNQVHIPGANGRGTNYVVTEDRVYIVDGAVCRVLDPANGQDVAEIRLPPDADGGEPEWGYIGVYQDVLIGGLGFAQYRERFDLQFDSDRELTSSRAGFGSKSLDRAASRALVGFDRHSGQMLWRLDANHSFWHNGIVAGRGRLYCLDKNPAQIEEAMRRRGLALPDTYRIVALDYRSGQPVWEVNEGIFGTWLGYSEQHDLLLQAGAQASDRLYAEVGQGMRVYEGETGQLRWKKDALKYAGPCILHNDLILTNANSYAESAGAFYLQSGIQKMVKNPLTGELQPWKMTRAYGCNNIVASENLLTFRSGAAGFYDLTSDSGTGNMGGFKSGCTSNLVVANGVLNAPDYTRTCSCSYQNQTSLALVHMPEVEMWSVNALANQNESDASITSLGINFGAPGDRRDADGVLWLEYPVVAGDSPPVPIRLNPEARFFQQHSSAYSGSSRPWIFASGVENVTELTIQLRMNEPYDLSAGLPVNHADDDAEENENGQVDLSSSDLELVEDGGRQLVGLRFNDISIARGARIEHAYLQFTCDESAGDPTSLLLTTELSPNSARFESVQHDISSRSQSRQEVAWSPGAWSEPGEAGEAQRSPDLRTMVQEVVDQPEWKAGNSMTFIISGSGKRVAVASRGPSESSPRLIIVADSSSEVASVDPLEGKRYDIELYFAAPQNYVAERLKSDNRATERVFDLYVQGELAATHVVISPGDESSDGKRLVLRGVAIADRLKLQFVPKAGQPVLSGIQITESR